MDLPGYLFAKPGQKEVVLISHGSQGIDNRMYDYVDGLQAIGVAALVIDHWTPRGITVTHDDYEGTSQRGGNEFNMAFDSLLAAQYLRGRGFERVGSMGESQGGAAAILLVQRWMHEMVQRNHSRLYGPGSLPLKPLDAIVSMYGYCGIRHALRDAYQGVPFLFITGDLDDNTPSKFCEQYVPWMNERGGKASIVVLKGYGHSFDAHYQRRRLFGRAPANCDILIDEKGVHLVGTNDREPDTAEGRRRQRDRCSTKMYHSGASGDRFVAVKHWQEFFRGSLRHGR